MTPPPELADAVWWWRKPNQRGVWLNRTYGNQPDWRYYKFPVPAAEATGLIPPDRHLQPHRIRDAFDLMEMEGDWVDRAVDGNPPTDVDKWEAGTVTPTRDQVARIAFLTMHRVEWFYPAPATMGRAVFMCGPGRSLTDLKSVFHEQDQPDGRREHPDPGQMTLLDT